MDFMLTQLSGLIDKLGGAIPNLAIPFEKLATFMAVLQPYLDEANILFPVSAIFTILVALASLRAVLMAIWVLKFIRSMLPF